MAELTVLEEKLAEVLGLAQAAKTATDKVSSLTDEPDLSTTLQRMHDEADETETRCTAVAGDIDGKKTAILDKARETKAEAAEMMKTYLGEDSDALDGFEFLTMAEAGEVGHWSVLRKLNERAQRDDVKQLVDWALPIQERHFQAVLDGSLELAGQEDPNEAS
jgi:energy-converting hydrogenase A subunit M